MIRQLTETVQSVSLDVDEDAGIIRGVRVLGLESANDRTYLRDGVRKAAALYEGKQVNVDHGDRPGQAVSVARRFGWLSGVRQDADGGLRADLHYLKSHPLAASVVEAARRNPRLVGLSHNASGKTRREGNREIVEAIEAVHSVDLVADPATVSGLHEGRGTVSVTVKQLTEDLKKKRPGYSRALREMAEAGLLSPDAMMDPPADAAGEESVDHEQAILDACKACLDDTALDTPAKLAKIKKLLGVMEGGKEPPASGDGGGDEEESAAKEENRKLKLQIAGLTALTEAGLKPDAILSKALTACKSEAEIKSLVEAAKALPARQNGARSAPITEGRKDTKEKPPEDSQALGRWLTTGGK